jgi:hypothetical protein
MRRKSRWWWLFPRYVLCSSEGFEADPIDRPRRNVSLFRTRDLREASGDVESIMAVFKDLLSSDFGRDRIYGTVTTRRLRAMGIRDKPTAASPWQNGFASKYPWRQCPERGFAERSTILDLGSTSRHCMVASGLRTMIGGSSFRCIDGFR